MGKAAKITRGGNKNRMNPGRADLKQKALGAKSHAISAKEALGSKMALMKKSQRIAEELRSKAASSPSEQSKQTIVRMASRLKPLAVPSPLSVKCPEKREEKWNENE